QYEGISSIKALAGLEEKNKEGFVVRFESGTRIKLKFNEYTRLHKLLTGITPRHIWESLRDKDSIESLIDRVPDEFYRWVRGIEIGLREQYAAIESVCRAEFRPRENRKDTAAYFQTLSHPSILFSMLDGKDYSGKIWKLIRPEPSKGFKRDEL
ncbi:MAG TPA: hypothetical protein VJX67_25850, partial [Blastocatellia bacterium]|nr:hypothetical protein [Blastocatellia bacterium]